MAFHLFQEHWKYEPFSAHKDENGDIYGRGTQDMKCVGIQYMEALKELKKKGHKFLRTIYLSFVPGQLSPLLIDCLSFFFFVSSSYPSQMLFEYAHRLCLYIFFPHELLLAQYFIDIYNVIESLPHLGKGMFYNFIMI